MTTWSGRVSAGGQSYTHPQARKVIAELLDAHVGRANATSLQQFTDRIDRVYGVSPRAVRAILADFDGIEYALHQQGDSVMFVAEYQDEADRTTRQQLSRARKLIERAWRRVHFVAALPRLQPGLFDEEELDDDDF